VEGDRELAQMRREAEVREAQKPQPAKPKPPVSPPVPRVSFNVLRNIARDADGW
jgi:hypothetical protein